MAVERVEVSAAVTDMEALQCGNIPVEYHRRRAARQMADEILEKAARYATRHDPRNCTTIHTWSVLVETDPTKLITLEQQLEVARRQGIKIAADRLRATAAHYLSADGRYAGVLRHQLVEQAQALDDFANRKDSQ